MEKLKAKPTYKIFILDEDKFNGLHKYIPEVKKEDLEQGLGFANPKTKECYVKRTGVKEWDDETIMHEATELLAKHSDHEDEQNIRWKKSGQIIRNVVSAIVAPFAPPVAAAMQLGHGLYEQSKGRQTLGQTLLGTAGAGIGGMMAAPAAKAGVAASKAAGGGILGQTLSGLQSTLTGTSGAQKLLSASPLQGPVTAAQSAMGYSNLSQVPQNLIGSAAATSALKAGTSGVSQATRNPFASQVLSSPTASTAPAASTGAGGVSTGTPSLIKGIGEKAGEFIKSPTNILGAASMGASLLPKTPQFEMPSYVSDLQSKLTQGEALSPLGQQARTSLSEILASKPSELYPTANDEYYNAALRRTRESYEQAARQIDANYNLAGTYGSGEHLAEKAKLQEQLARTESALFSETEQRRFELARTAQYQAIQDSLGVDKQVMDDLVGLTGLDVQTAAMVYGAQAADIQAIRESLGTLGVELLMRGTGVKQDGGVNINLG